MNKFFNITTTAETSVTKHVQAETVLLMWRFFILMLQVTHTVAKT